MVLLGAFLSPGNKLRHSVSSKSAAISCVCPFWPGTTGTTGTVSDSNDLSVPACGFAFKPDWEQRELSTCVSPSMAWSSNAKRSVIPATCVHLERPLLRALLGAPELTPAKGVGMNPADLWNEAHV